MRSIYKWVMKKMLRGACLQAVVFCVPPWDGDGKRGLGGLWLEMGATVVAEGGCNSVKRSSVEGGGRC